MHTDPCAAHLTALLAGEPAPPKMIRFARLDDAMRHLAHTDVNCVLLDLELPDAPNIHSVERVLAAHPQMPIVALTNGANVKAIRLIRAGARNFVAKKTPNSTDLLQSAANAVERQRTG